MTPNTSCLGPMGNVRKIQTALNLLSDVNLDIDGIYGPVTAAAVKKFKERRSAVFCNRGRRAPTTSSVSAPSRHSMTRWMSLRTNRQRHLVWSP